MKKTTNKFFITPIQSEQKQTSPSFDTKNSFYRSSSRKIISPSFSSKTIRLFTNDYKSQMNTISNRSRISKRGKNLFPLNDIKLKLNLKIRKEVPLYVETSQLKKTIQDNSTSNFNNRYNVFYKKRKETLSPKSKMYEERYRMWNELFMISLKKQKKEYEEMKGKKIVMFNRLLPNIMMNKSKSTAFLLSKL